MGNYMSKKEANNFERSSSKRWKKYQKPRNYYQAVSDLDAEHKVPVHLHYRSRDSVEEDLFTTDSRTPCLIHLHQFARNDSTGTFKDTENYTKPTRPKSFDPNLLLGDDYSAQHAVPSKSTINIVANPNLTDLYNPQSLLPTPKEKMAIDCAQHKAEVITVDTSGAQFERRVHLRRSQRSSISAVRRKNQQKFRDRHKTLTALPGCVADELGLHHIHELDDMPSDRRSNSSFFGDNYLIQRDSTFSSQEKPHAVIQTDDIKLLTMSPIKRRFKNRHSMPNAKSVPTSPQRQAKVIRPSTTANGTFPRNNISTNTNEANTSKLLRNGQISTEHASHKRQSFMREKTNMVEDRMSSGFWSGTESCRHSTTSENLAPNHNVTKALQQIQSKKFAQIANERSAKGIDTDSDLTASTLSLNSHLSTLEHSLLSSSSFSLSYSSLPPPADQTSTTFDSSCIPRSELDTPRQVNLSTPDGAYKFMNPNYVEEQAKLNHLASPMDLLILGNRRGNDGRMKANYDETSSAIHSLDQNGCYISTRNDSGMTKQDSNLPAPAQTQEVLDVNHTLAATPLENGKNRDSDFISNNNPPPIKTQSPPQDKKESVGKSVNDVKENEVKKQSRHEIKSKRSRAKPVPPRRGSSLKSPRYCETQEILTYMEPSSDANDVVFKSPIQKTPNLEKSPDKSFTEKTKSFVFEVTDNVVGKRTSSAKVTNTSKSSATTDDSSFQQSHITSAKHESSVSPRTQLVSRNGESPSSPCVVSSSGQPKLPESMGENKTKITSLVRLSKQDASVEKLADGIYAPVNIANNSENTSLSIKSSSAVNDSLGAPSQSSDTQNEANKHSRASTPPGGRTLEINKNTEDKPDLVIVHIPDSVESPTFPPPSLDVVDSSASPDQKDSSYEREANETPSNVEIKLPISNQGELMTTKENISLNVISAETKSSTSSTKPLPQPVVALNDTHTETAPLKCLITPVTFNPKRNGLQKINDGELPTKETVSSPAKPPVATKPSRLLRPLPVQSNVKQTIRPKPLLLPKPRVLEKENQEKIKENSQVGSKSQQVKPQSTASARAAFFGLAFEAPTAETTKCEVEKKVACPVIPLSPKQDKEEMFNGETDIDAVDVDDVIGNSNTKIQGVTCFDFNLKNIDSVTPTAEVKAPTDTVVDLTPTLKANKTAVENKLRGETKSDNKLKPKSSPEKPACDSCVEGTNKKLKNMNHQEVTLLSTTEDASDCEEAAPCDSAASDSAAVIVQLAYEKGDRSPTEVTAEDITSPKTVTDRNSDFMASMHRLRGSLRHSKEGTKPQLLSPTSTERRVYARSNTSSLDRRRRITSGSTSREDFKALLLQSFSKSATGAQMTATEKLQKSMQSSKVNRRNYEEEDVTDSPPGTPRPRMVSAMDIRSAVSTSRQGRRQNRTQDFRKSYAGCTNYSYKKHPPIAHNGRFHTLNRTHSRPMVAISEDVENEAAFEANETRARSASVSCL